MLRGALPFLARRRAFLDGGSGALTSTLISCNGLLSRLRFVDGGGDCLGDEEEDDDFMM